MYLAILEPLNLSVYMYELTTGHCTDDMLVVKPELTYVLIPEYINAHTKQSLRGEGLYFPSLQEHCVLESHVLARNMLVCTFTRISTHLKKK